MHNKKRGEGTGHDGSGFGPNPHKPWNSISLLVLAQGICKKCIHRCMCPGTGCDIVIFPTNLLIQDYHHYYATIVMTSSYWSMLTSKLELDYMPVISQEFS